MLISQNKIFVVVLISSDSLDQPEYLAVLIRAGLKVYQKFNFLISQPKHMLWVLRRTVSMNRFF